MQSRRRKRINLPENFPYKENEPRIYEGSLVTCSRVVISVPEGSEGKYDPSATTCVFKRIYTENDKEVWDKENPKYYKLYSCPAIVEIIVPGNNAPESSYVYPLSDGAHDFHMDYVKDVYAELLEWWAKNEGTVINPQTGVAMATGQKWISIEEQLNRLYPERVKKEEKEIKKEIKAK